MDLGAPKRAGKVELTRRKTMFRLLIRLAVLRLVNHLSTASISGAKGRNRYVALLASLVAAKLAGSRLRGRP